MTSPSRIRAHSLRLLVIGLALLVGVPLGAGLRFAFGDPAGGSDAVPDTDAPTVAALPTVELETPTEALLLAWRPDGLPEGIEAALIGAPGVAATTVVRRETLGLVAQSAGVGQPVPVAADGGVVPFDVMAFDPGTFPEVVAPSVQSTLRSLQPGELVAGRTAAQVRGLDAGATLVFADRSLEVAAVVDDDVIGGAEAAVVLADAEALGLVTPRYLLVRHDRDRAAIEDLLSALLPPPVRFRSPGETPFLRDADAVLPLASVKARFGELSVRLRGDAVIVDETWRAENLVETSVPLLGEVRCHRGVIDPLRAALRQVESERIGYLIDPSTSTACFAPARIGDSSHLSRHTWGIAVDLNTVKNPRGVGSVQDRRVVEIMQEHGFVWGGDWLAPEPSYFEYVGPSI